VAHDKASAFGEEALFKAQTLSPCLSPHILASYYQSVLGRSSADRAGGPNFSQAEEIAKHLARCAAIIDAIVARETADRSPVPARVSLGSAVVRTALAASALAFMLIILAPRAAEFRPATFVHNLDRSEVSNIQQSQLPKHPMLKQKTPPVRRVLPEPQLRGGVASLGLTATGPEVQTGPPPASRFAAHESDDAAGLPSAQSLKHRDRSLRQHVLPQPRPKGKGSTGLLTTARLKDRTGPPRTSRGAAEQNSNNAARALSAVPFGPYRAASAPIPAPSRRVPSHGELIKPVIVTSAGRLTFWRLTPGGVIARSNDGVRWQPLDSGTSNDLFAGAAPSAEICWVVGRGGTVLRTTNGGMRHRPPMRTW
jgi:hypothetical protein